MKSKEREVLEMISSEHEPNSYKELVDSWRQNRYLAQQALSTEHEVDFISDWWGRLDIKTKQEYQKSIKQDDDFSDNKEDVIKLYIDLWIEKYFLEVDWNNEEEKKECYNREKYNYPPLTEPTRLYSKEEVISLIEDELYSPIIQGAFDDYGARMEEELSDYIKLKLQSLYSKEEKVFPKSDAERKSEAFERIEKKVFKEEEKTFELRKFDSLADGEMKVQPKVEEMENKESYPVTTHDKKKGVVLVDKNPKFKEGDWWYNNKNHLIGQIKNWKRLTPQMIENEHHYKVIGQSASLELPNIPIISEAHDIPQVGTQQAIQEIENYMNKEKYFDYKHNVYSVPFNILLTKLQTFKKIIEK